MPDFIFQHGAMMGGHIWDELIAAMRVRAPDSRFLALDAPGCGAKRGLDVSEMAFDAAVADVLADVDSSGMTDIVLVGHSQGGTLLPCIAEGLTNREIAETLVISIKTVERHRENIMAKLDMHNRVELVKYAIKKGLIAES